MYLIAAYAYSATDSAIFMQCCPVNLRCSTRRVRLHAGCGLALDSGGLKTWLSGCLVGDGLGNAFQVDGLGLRSRELAELVG